MEVVLISLGFIIGSVLGSFVKVLADRSLTNKSLLGRSYCLRCQKSLRWYDLFPILAFLILRGRCRYCQQNLHIEYLLVELGVGLLVAFLFWNQFSSFTSFADPFKLAIFILELLFKTFFVTILAALFLTDLKKMLIPDRIILPAIVIGISSFLLITLIKIGYLYYFLSQTTLGRLLLPPHSDYFQRHAYISAQPFLGAVLTALAIGGFFWALIIVTRGKGMGGGDVKLGAFIGLMLGFPQGIVAIILSFLTGAAMAIFLIILGRKHFGQSIPFGPFLVLGSLTALFWGRQIIDWYLHLTI